MHSTARRWMHRHFLASLLAVWITALVLAVTFRHLESVANLAAAERVLRGIPVAEVAE